MNARLISLVVAAMVVVSCSGGKMKETTELTEAEFVERVAYVEPDGEIVFLAGRPTAVLFYAAWSPPCDLVIPTMESVLSHYNGKLNVYKIDVGKAKQLTHELGITSIPTLLLLSKKGDPLFVRGAKTRDDYISLIDQNIFQRR
jgi:thioredoxin 1